MLLCECQPNWPLIVLIQRVESSCKTKLKEGNNKNITCYFATSISAHVALKCVSLTDCGKSLAYFHNLSQRNSSLNSWSISALDVWNWPLASGDAVEHFIYLLPQPVRNTIVVVIPPNKVLESPQYSFFCYSSSFWAILFGSICHRHWTHNDVICNKHLQGCCLWKKIWHAKIIQQLHYAY